MHATRCKRAVLIVEHPPLAGVAGAAKSRESRAELVTVAAFTDSVDHLRREQAFAVYLTLV